MMKRALALILFACSAAAVPPASPGKSAAAPVIVRGAVVVKTDAHRAYVAFKAAATDGPADHLFKFWSEANMATTSLSYKDALLNFDPAGHLNILFPDDQRSITFSVEGVKSMPAAPEGFTSTAYVGYGLNHSVGEAARAYKFYFNGPEINGCDVDCVFNLTESGGSGGGGCQSGGPGSNSCSLTINGNGCSVSCASGYYACCSRGQTFGPPNCVCIKQ